MNENFGGEDPHPAGESENALVPAEEAKLVIDMQGGRYRANFDQRTPVSALGPPVFFAQCLQASSGLRRCARTRH